MELRILLFKKINSIFTFVSSSQKTHAMKLNSTRAKLVFISLTFFMLTTSAQAQSYCSPVFAYGCFSWRNENVTLDSIHWIADPYYCDISDYSGVSTTLHSGASYNMQVTNGNWCGCGVWIDFNNDYSFDTTENVFHSYQANETNNYNFDVAIPANISEGDYRLRVIAGWGSDCYNPGANGYGPCGLYQYGNFDDFTIHIAGFGTGGTDFNNTSTSLQVNPNPATTSAVVTLSDDSGILQLTNLLGEVIYSINVNKKNEALDLSTMPIGIYLLRYSDGIHLQQTKLIKQ